MIWFIVFVTICQLAYLLFLFRMLKFHQEYYKFQDKLTLFITEQINEGNISSQEIEAIFKELAIEKFMALIWKFWHPLDRKFDEMEFLLDLHGPQYFLEKELNEKSSKRK